MTKIVGTIRDVHLAGASGTLTIWSGFRPTTTSVIAPRRRVWDVEHGTIVGDVEVAPGPAVVQLNFGPSAFRSWPVEVPDQPEITIHELLLHSVPWGPEVQVPPPEEVDDLLRLIADTAEEYRLSLQADTDVALDRIASAVSDAQAGVIAGQTYSTEAQGYMQAALDYATNALSHAQTAAVLAGDTQGYLDATQALRDQADAVAAQIADMNAEIAAKAGEVADNADAVSSDAADAAARADQAQTLTDQAAHHLQQVQAAVAEGERQVMRATNYADEASTLVGDASGIIEAAEQAQADAQAALSTIEGIGTDVDQIQTQVLGMHAEILSKHTEVLDKHGEAIAASAAASAAAGEAAGQALEATEANAEAQSRFAAQQEQFNEDYAARSQLQAMMLEAVRQAQAAALFERWYILTAPLDETRMDDRVHIHAGVNEATVTAFGSWIGRMVIHAGWNTSGGNSGERILDVYVPQPDGSRTVTLNKPTGSGGRVWTKVDYSMNPGEQVVRTRDGGNDTAGGGNNNAHANMNELAVHRFTVPQGAQQITVSFDIGWNDANFLDRFAHEIRLNGVMLDRYSAINMGPLIGNAYRKRNVTVVGVAANPGDVLSFWAGTSGSKNAIRDSHTRITYVRLA